MHRGHVRVLAELERRERTVRRPYPGTPGIHFVEGLLTSGLSLVVAGALTVTIPLVIGVLVGRWVFKMHPGVLLGVVAGGCTATPALAAVQEVAKSAVPSMGYGVAYAVGNVLLAIWGTIIVAMLA